MLASTEKERLHFGHRKGRSPVCVRMWLQMTRHACTYSYDCALLGRHLRSHDMALGEACIALRASKRSNAVVRALVSAQGLRIYDRGTQLQASAHRCKLLRSVSLPHVAQATNSRHLPRPSHREPA